MAKMTKVITALTKEQEADIQPTINNWLEYAHTTNREEAKKAVEALYEFAGQGKPRVVFTSSPLTAAILATIWDDLIKRLSLGASLSDSLGDSIRASLDASLRDSLRDSLRASLDDSLRASLDDSLSDSLRDSLRDSLSDSIRDSLGASIRDSLSDSLSDSIRDSLRASLDASLSDSLRASLSDSLSDSLRDSLDDSLSDSLDMNWWHGWWRSSLSVVDFCMRHLKTAMDLHKAEIYVNMGKHVARFIPYKNVVFVSDKPIRTVFVGPQLSYDHGKAVEYSDGWGYYMLRGVRFNEEQYNAIVEENLTLEDLAKDTYKLGDDQRVVAIQMLRPDRLLEQMGAKLIDDSKLTGTKLYKVDNFLDTNETEYCMRMTHPSINGREYIEWVEPKIGKIGKADYAQAVAFGVAEEDLSLPAVQKAMDLYITAVKA